MQISVWFDIKSPKYDSELYPMVKFETDNRVKFYYQVSYHSLERLSKAIAKHTKTRIPLISHDGWTVNIDD